ncbi:Protein CBG26452 [Caenorhabditis briggsae]|uniref:Uncharacterized protein n=3 Tax=Caenorhabditis briggsae TaxID=6238 RepID=A0AAE9JHA2_CAEBR|nr:Protein CBG26452 [Caenorhabditis briggsae]ULT96715.1 hypothetical protein L3Y34_004926 [Caenorhabditis briggsae]UMM29895.1 hypothetical protein L5515_012022 [Caenorhabditis briggsae]CAS00469.1 Protein CBG26452 [Caenorhabditis briggsae]
MSLIVQEDSDDDSFVFVDKIKKEGKKKDDYKMKPLNTLISGLRKNTNKEPDYENNARFLSFVTLVALIIAFTFKIGDLTVQYRELENVNRAAMEKISNLQKEIDKNKQLDEQWNAREEVYGEPSGGLGRSENVICTKQEQEKVMEKGNKKEATMTAEEVKLISEVLHTVAAAIYVALVFMALRHLRERRRRAAQEVTPIPGTVSCGNKK